MARDHWRSFREFYAATSCLTWTARLGGSQIPHSRPVEEARDDAVFADLEDGAEVAGNHGGGCAGAFSGSGVREQIGTGQRVQIVTQDRAEGEQTAARIRYQGTVQACQGLEHGGVKLGDRSSPSQVVKRTFGQRIGERVARELSHLARARPGMGRLGLDSWTDDGKQRRWETLIGRGGGIARIHPGVAFKIEFEHVMRSNEPADGPRGVCNNHEQPSLTLLGKVERGLEQHAPGGD